MINTASAFPPRAHSAGLLDSGQSCSTEVLMRRIGLAVALTFSLLGPLAAEAQPSAKIPRLGYLVIAPLSETP